MDKNQEFILEKIKYGLANKHPAETISREDIERLNWDADDYSKVPCEEWSEWSRKSHLALQVAFINDTDRAKDKAKINEWKTICFNTMRDVLENKRKSLVIDSLILHFVKNDLAHHIIDTFGWESLSKEEQIWFKAFLREKRKEK